MDFKMIEPAWLLTDAVFHRQGFVKVKERLALVVLLPVLAMLLSGCSGAARH